MSGFRAAPFCGGLSIGALADGWQQLVIGLSVLVVGIAIDAWRRVL